MNATVTHVQYQKNYYQGFDTAKADVAKDGFEKSRDLFNEKFPVGCKFAGLDEYYFASGYMNGLLAK
jgi:hypothetical protein